MAKDELTAELPPTGGADCVDIRQFRAEIETVVRPKALARADFVAQGQPIELQFTPAVRFTGGALDRRLLFGSFAVIGQYRRFLQYEDRPAAFIKNPAGHDRDDEWGHEQRILAHLGQQRALSRAAVAHVVGQLPEAKHGKTVVYEETAEGMQLDAAISYIGQAYGRGWLTDRETALLLHILKPRARQVLWSLHGAGIQHKHPELCNMNLKLPTGEVTGYDYTQAVIRTVPVGSIFFRDVDCFERSWIRATGWFRPDASLIEQLSSASHVEQQAVLAKLEVVIRRVQLRKLGVDNPTEADAQYMIEARKRLLAAAPDISYPRTASGS